MRTANDLIVNGEVILSGTVLLDEWAAWMWDEDVYFTPRLVREALASLGEGRATVRVNSSGGHVMAGEQIRAILAAHPGGCRMVVEGWAASAASLLFMAGAERAMSAGSLLMIHDPSGGVWGTEAEMRKEADVMGKMADVYAAVYARASGRTVAEARAVMLAETYLGPEEAIAGGWAHEIVEEAPLPAVTADAGTPRRATMAAVRDAVMATGRTLAARLQRNVQPAMMVTAKEAVMPTENPATVVAPLPTSPVTAAAPAPVAQVPAADAVMAERARIRDIRAMAQPFVASGRLAAADVDALIDDGTPAHAAGQRFLVQMAAAEPANAGRATATILRDEVDTRRSGIEGALVARMANDRDVTGPARDFMGLSLAEMVAASAGQTGRVGRAAGDQLRVIEMAFGSHSTSDFPALFENALNKRLLSAYAAAMPTYRAIAQRMDFADFRPHPIAGVGDWPNLLPVTENGEIKFGTVSDKKETVALIAYARGLRISRQMIVNDDLGGIDRILVSRGRAVAAFEEQNFFAMFLSGANADGPTLLETTRQVFNTTDLTKAGTAAAITAANVAIGIQAMRGRKGVSGEAFLDVTPSILLTGPAKEFEGLQLLAPIQAAQASNVNPYVNRMTQVVSPYISGNAWYLFADPASVPAFMYGYLQGEAGPRMRMEEPFGQQGVGYTVELDFGVGAVDYRGGWKNAGA
jgi:ATP-dependent protease ClpP protease subunit